MTQIRDEQVFLNIRASTTIGIASETIRLALARSVLLSGHIVVTRVGWPSLFKKRAYPSVIYEVLEAPRLCRGNGLAFLKSRVLAFLSQSIESIYNRTTLLANLGKQIPNGQAGLYSNCSAQNLATSDRNSLHFGLLRRVARATRGFGPVRLAKDRVQYCESIIADMGVGQGEWFICLHVRTSAFHGDDAGYRNATFGNYQLAIDHIIAMGGKVVRMGDPGVGIVPYPTPGLIDYPNTRWKSELMDLFLIERCRFFVGTLSGILDTSYLLQRPTLCVNSIHFDMRSPNPHDRVLYKQVRRLGDVAPMTFNKAMEHYQDILAPDWPQKYEFLENSESEILAAVREFISVIEGKKCVTPRQSIVRRKLIRERLKLAADQGSQYSMLAASIAFSRCHVVDFSLSGCGSKR